MVAARSLFAATAAIGMVALLSSTGGCGSNKDNLGEGDDASAEFGSSSGAGASSGGNTFGGGSDAGGGSPCVGNSLSCNVSQNCTTTISGTVYDPAGVNPLYNVAVFIPTDPKGALPAIKQGTNTCSSCDVSIGDYVTATTSAADGTFTLTGVPAGKNIPLVVQIGKWRREVFLPTVTACQDNTMKSTGQVARLPAKRSEGSIPQMAIVTGGADNLGCFLKGIGLDPSEYSAPGAGGRLDVYQGLPADQTIIPGLLTASGAPKLSSGTAGDCTTADNPKCVWSSKANFEKYDIVLLACEGDTDDPDDADFKEEMSMAGGQGGGGAVPFNKSVTAKNALHDWLDEGGKVFATHFQYTWFKNSPKAEFQTAANWLGSSTGGDTGLYDIDTTIPKGKVLSQWLGTVGALQGTQISLSGVAESVSTVNAASQRWIYNPGKDRQANAKSSMNDTKYMSIVTPIGGIPITTTSDAGGSESTGAQYCGKAVFSDLHAGGNPDGDIPGACKSGALTAQLKALEFLFFDLSACVSNDSLPPPNVPPPAK